jgi:hypothetical protein
MSVDITIRVPDDLGQQLERYRDRLPELLERGLRDVQVEDSASVSAATDIIAVLTSQPTPEQVLALGPSDAMQERVSELLRRSKTDGLSRAEESELDRYLYLEHLVRLAKARALEHRPPGE